MNTRLQLLEALVEEARREEQESELRKCGARGPVEYKKRTKDFLTQIIDESGGASELAKELGCNESNVRAMRRDPGRFVAAEAFYVGDPDVAIAFAEDVKANALARKAMRRAG